MKNSPIQSGFKTQHSSSSKCKKINEMFNMIIVLLFKLCLQSFEIETCKTSQSVQWFFFVKMPGSGFFYYDSLMPARGQKHCQVNFRDPVDSYDSPLEETLGQYNSYNRIQYIWNDKPSNFVDKRKQALAKGVIFYKNQSERGVLMNHGFDRYPTQKFQNSINAHLNSKYGVRGAHFFCMNLLKDDLIMLLPQLSQMRVNMQGYYVTRNIDPAFYQFADSNETSESTVHHFLVSHFNQTILIVTKPNGLIENLWAAVAQEIDDALILAGRGDCLEGWERVHSVYGAKGDEQKLYLISQDHSKWGIGKKSNWVCTADLESKKEQKGGSAYCIKNEGLKQGLLEMINEKHICHIEQYDL